MKTTEQLLEELSSLEIEDYLSENSDEFVEGSIASLLNEIIEKKNLIKSDIIDKSQLNKVYAYQIFQGKRFPSRDKVIPLCLAMKLNLEEMQEILRASNMPALYVRNRRDSIIIFAFEKGLDVLECNELLYEAGERLLG
ncbi:MAG: XRE family transcriptional regulator [Ruminiclostridium sp.]